MKKVLIFAFNEMEDVEFSVPFDVFQRNNLSVEVFTLEENNGNIKTKFNLHISDLKTYSQIVLEEFDALFIPGGPGVEKIIENQTIKEVINHFADNSKLVGAICAAPQIIANSGRFTNSEVIAFNDSKIYSFIESKGLKVISKACLNGQDCEVVVSDNLVTGLNYESSFKFAKVMVNQLTKEQ